jgi:hypothetical protein
MVRKSRKVVLYNTGSVTEGKVSIWHFPNDLRRIPSVAAEQAMPRERRAYGWLRREVRVCCLSQLIPSQLIPSQ